MRIKGQSAFKNKKCFFDGFWFDSQDEANYWAYLKLRLKAGEISKLERQTRFDLTVNSKLLGWMLWDFTFIEKDKQIAFDWKGYKGQDKVWDWKRKHCEAQYPEWIFRTNLDKEKKRK